MSLDKYISENSPSKEHGYFSTEKFLVLAPSRSQVSLKENSLAEKFFMWSLFPFITRDVAVWVPESVESSKVQKVIKEHTGKLVILEPELFDEFKKPASSAGGDGKGLYAFRIVFQSMDRTLTDTEVNEIINKINKKIEENKNWQVR